tara:strand:+ start:1126 stop:2208 length:1083 start_codon:yes stop_codon:yes gene_type:complete
MKKDKILFITGARPNLVKLSPIYNFFKKKNYFNIDFLHTNQHSEKTLYLNQLKDLKLPVPKNLIKKKKFNSDIEMISYLMREVYFSLKKIKPQYVVIFGDVDSTLAAALSASKLYIPIIHIESGLRSKFMSSKEEINRRIIDKVSTFNFATTPLSLRNLINEGLKKNSFYVGNIILENFFNLKKNIYSSKILNNLNINKNEYFLVTLHRYQNIDNPIQLKKILSKIKYYLENYKIVFCIHPRTKKKIKNIDKKIFKKENLIFVDALAYTDFTKLLLNSKLIITDSGGVLEEAYFHKRTCYVIRNDIERIELVNNINTFQIKDINKAVFTIVNKRHKDTKLTKLWDSSVSKRVFNILKNIL